MNISRPLRWGLLATLTLTVAALLWRPRIDSVQDSGGQSSATSTQATGLPLAESHQGWADALSPTQRSAKTSSATRPPLQLPTELVRPDFSTATVDLFADASVAHKDATSLPARQAPSGPGQSAVAAPASHEPVHTSSPLVARYIGRLLTPDGAQLIFVQDGNQLMLATPGAVHSSGYIVDALSLAGQAVKPGAPEFIHFVHARTGHRESMRLPIQNPL